MAFCQRVDDDVTRDVELQALALLGEFLGEEGVLAATQAFAELPRPKLPSGDPAAGDAEAEGQAHHRGSGKLRRRDVEVVVAQVVGHRGITVLKPSKTFAPASGSP